MNQPATEFKTPCRAVPEKQEYDILYVYWYIICQYVDDRIWPRPRRVKTTRSQRHVPPSPRILDVERTTIVVMKGAAWVVRPHSINQLVLTQRSAY